MKKSRLIYAITPVIFALAAGCSAISGEKKDSSNGTSGSGDTATVTGCLSTDASGRFALTAATDAVGAAAARGFDGERDTRSYVLIGGENLAAHLGKKVEVIGTIEGKTIDMEHKDTREQKEPAASGGDNNQPSVKTKEEIDLQARQLNVREIRDVAPECVVNQ